MYNDQPLDNTISERDFTIERDFNAPRTLVFDAFTRPEHLKNWWAPQPYTIPVCTVDLHPGGVWHYCMRSPEGQDNWARSVYREIVPPEKLSYSTTFSDEHANIIGDVPEHLTIIIFTEVDNKTHVSTRVQFESAASMQAALDMGMLIGMNMTWGYLADYIQQIQSA